MQDCLSLSVIIPVLNEAESLPRLLEQLLSQRQVALDIIVADGGSSDGSRELAAQQPVRVIQTPRGRAIQLNHGAALARYDQLLFIHADSTIADPYLIAGALRHWSDYGARSQSGKVAGHFKLSFERSSDKHARAFRYLEEKSASNRPQTINGDQGLLIGRQFFEHLGGYDEALPFMEDQKIAQQIFERGEWTLLPGTLFTSARRFETEGFHRRYMLMGLMMAFYWTNTPEFFKRARNVYPDQREAQKLRLCPYFKAIWLVLAKDLGLRRSLVHSYRMGRYVRQNAWQAFFFFDVNCRALSGKEQKQPFTRFYNRFLQPLTDNRLADLLVTPCVVIWYLLVLGPVFYLLDRKSH